ncbi:MAG TPA: hypothetical protein VFH29_10185, partial [Anaerolineales bacterium]|nr:hypothetical protein [Anaerolineales bacterium]
AEAIPLEGALDVAWSGLPEAFSYEFDVIPPTGAGNPWVIRTEGTSRTIYMENFPEAGQYRFGLSALDAKGAVLCATELTFDKGALDEKTRTGSAADGAGKAPCTSMLACP